MDDLRRVQVNALVATVVHGYDNVRIRRTYSVDYDAKGRTIEDPYEAKAVHGSRSNTKDVRNYAGDIELARATMRRVISYDPDVRIRIENHGSARDDREWSICGGDAEARESELEEAMAVWAVRRRLVLAEQGR